jgi:aspartyl-tRNA(Asn)/glutamyl-tRNA(Gln) amidotransferase subunit A
MAHGALGTDTGGSCRIPAAFCGITGFKPTARRVPLDGALPLSPTLDSIGPLARSVSCCAILDSVLAGETPEPLPELPLDGLRLLVPETVVLDTLDPDVATAFEAALSRLSVVGARIMRGPVPELAEIAPMSAKGGFTAAESHAWHHAMLAERSAAYDLRVASRILRGGAMTARDYIELLAWRRDFIQRVEARTLAHDAMLLPCVAIVPPRIDALDAEDAYTRANLLALRNCTVVNMMDGCAISLPIARPSEPPVGLMVAGRAGTDRRILAVAAAAERLLAPCRV